ncbi:MAG: NAD(P)-dependent oxidoreductase [Pseudomonadota bacterium]
MKSFPLFLNVVDESVAVAGGGEAAAQKARLVLKTEARLVVMAPELCDELAGLVADGRAEHVAEVCDPEMIASSRLAFVATGCAGGDAAIASLARAKGVLVNTVDRPDLCDVTTPALVDRDPVVVAIGTEGAAPVLARQIKTAVERMLEPNLGGFVRLAGQLRNAVAKDVEKPKRRAFWEWAFNQPRRLFARGEHKAAERMLHASIRSHGADLPVSGTVSVVGAGPGAPDLLTLRAVDRLQSADLILVGPGVGPAVLELARRDAERVCADLCDLPQLASQAQNDGQKVVVLGRAGAEAEVGILGRHGLSYDWVRGVGPSPRRGAGAENRRADAHDRGTERDRRLEVAAHSHR